jgi:hypothetical protein
MSGLQQAQLLYAAAVRSRVPPWAPFLQFPNVFGTAPFLSNRHQLVNTSTNDLSTSHVHSTIHQQHRNQPEPNSEDSNDERGM